MRFITRDAIRLLYDTATFKTKALFLVSNARKTTKMTFAVIHMAKL